MENSPELIQKGKYLGTITTDFVKVASLLKEASYALRKRKISEYPIFPICKEKTAIGKLLVNKSEKKLEWNYHFSLLEEFVERKLIEKEKVDRFKEAFKNPDEYCCLFVIDQDFINFIFIPYPEDEGANVLE
ncbi:MAG: hypothetical protein OHK0038_16470 [Flammeovirgaceae bacterium]